MADKLREEDRVSNHILDRPVWTALNTRQSRVAVGGDLARKFTPDIGPLAASVDNGAKSLEALAKAIYREPHITSFDDFFLSYQYILASQLRLVNSPTQIGGATVASVES